ncbi:MAG: SagB/ThcOx family dehydrogenase [Rhizobium sp.]|nr:SagB/ThcOx family dehydrogenase [Rhizobium sp.]
MRMKCSEALVFTPSDGQFIAYNFLEKSVFECSADLLDLLSRLKDWMELDDLRNELPDFEPDEIDAILQGLLSVGALVREDTPDADKEREYRENWSWGLPTALMHFSVQDNPFITVSQAEDIQREKVRSVGLMDLHRANSDKALKLPDPMRNDLIQLMAKRRTIRRALPVPVKLDQVSDCLFSGLGITGWMRNCVGMLPLSMTPSGGGRNPYEAYVFARNVDGLERGVYHYSALGHNLERVADLEEGDITTLIGGQEWGDDKPCMILLCAHMERTMWKYEDPNAYRVIMIEAGHIGQNIMLAATEHGLTACPTAALDHAHAKSILGLTDITQAPIYALTLSMPMTEEGASPEPCHPAH